MGIFDKPTKQAESLSEPKLSYKEKQEAEEKLLEQRIDEIKHYETISDSDKGIEMKPEFWGCLWKYIQDDTITDVDYNGKDLWLTYIDGRHIKVQEHELTDTFIDILIQRIANGVSLPFNNATPVLEAETKDLRISVIHEASAQTGRTFCVRKTPEFVRITTQNAIKERYATKEELCFLANCVKAKLNIAVCGEPGVGKTELAKYLSSFIPDDQRVITIEDTLEWHYESIHPTADCVSLKVSDKFDYFTAIKSCLRQNPKWLMLSEARGDEVKAYIQQLSTGTHGITTLHCDGVRKIPDRLVNMSSSGQNRDKMEYDIYNFLNVGILVNKTPDKNNTERRFIDQIAVYGMEANEKLNALIFNDMELTRENVMDRLPRDIQSAFKKAGITDPLVNEEILKTLETS